MKRRAMVVWWHKGLSEQANSALAKCEALSEEAYILGLTPN